MSLPWTRRQLSLFVGLVTLCCGLLTVVHGGRAFAYTNSDIDCRQDPSIRQNHCLEDGLNSGPNSAYAWDRDTSRNSCYDYLNAHKNSSTYTMRDIINGVPGGGEAAYKDDTWLSPKNYSKTTVPTLVDYGDTSVPLQINSVTFLCGPMILNDNGLSTVTNVRASPYSQNVLDQSARWVSPNDAEDHAPNSPGSANLYPARTGTNTKILSVSIDRGASNNLPPGSSITGTKTGDLTISRSNSTRYWFANPMNDLTFQSDDPGVIQEALLVVDLEYKSIFAYAGGVYRCDGAAGNGFITVDQFDSFGQCKVLPDTLHLKLTPKPAPSHAPTGTLLLSCSVDKTKASATATFKDLDGSAQYPLTGKLTSSIYSSTKTVNATNGAMSLGNVPVPQFNPTVTFTLKVNDVGADPTKPDFVLTKSINCKQPPGGNCPSLPDSHVTVNLPDQAPNNPAPVGTTGTPNDRQEQDTPQRKTQVTSIDDISPGGSRDPPTKVSEAYQQVVLDYNPYINDYSYDDNQPSVTYDSYYDKTEWFSSSTPDGYTCPYGGSLSGSTCRYAAPASPGSTYCASGTWDIDNNVGDYGSQGAHDALFNHCVAYQHPLDSGSPPTRCTSYYSWIAGGGCYSVVGSPITTPTTYSCSYPASLSGTTCSYGGTPYYNWHKGAVTTNQTRPNTVNGQLMTACYDRSFRVDSVTGDQTNLDDNENPFQVFGGGGTITVSFAYDGDPTHIPARGLRLPMKVNLDLDTNYTINDGGPPLCGQQTGPPVTVNGNFGPGKGTATVPMSSCSATVPPLQAGDEVCGEYDISPTGDNMQVNGDVKPPGGNGQTATDTSCSHKVVNEPYARFYGNDVTAGGAFATGANQCAGAPMSLGTISGFERGSGPQATGAGSQFAALSLGQIQGFASAFLRSLAPTSPTGLSFANTTAGFGGNLGSTYQHCVPDYYATLPASNNGDWPGSYAAPGGAYTHSGNLTLGPGTVPDGANISIYVNGDVYITGGDIVYQTDGWTVTGNTSNEPSLYIIATGSINIDPSVHTLDGVYVAQNNTIHTCAPDAGSANLYDATELYSNCHSSLRVNGSFVARNIVLDRTYSSLRHSQPGENPFGGGAHPCDVAGGVRVDPQIDCSAEIFNSGLETYMSSPAMAPSGGPKSGKFDAITSLSPIL